jgi:thiamine transport system substrate-binding protein
VFGCEARLRGEIRQPAEPDLAHTSGGIAGGFHNPSFPFRNHFLKGDDMKKIIISLLAATAFVLPAAAKDALTVYTYDSFAGDYGPGKAVKSAFEKTCDCDLNFVTLGDGVAMLNRLKLEGKDTKADVVLGLDTNLTAEAKGTGLFGTHGVDVARATVPGGWKDDTFLPYDYGYFAVVYNTETLKNPPKSLDELVNGDASQKIVLEDPRASTPGLGFLLWMKQVYGDKAPDAWKKLKPRILTTAASWDDAYALFTKGEAPMVFSYVTSPAYHMIEEKTEKYQAANFAEGHYLQIEVAGVIEGSAHKALAQKFMGFMLSPDFQDLIPTTNWMMPAAKTSAPLPPEFEKLVKPTKTLLYSPEDVAAHRRDWVDEWMKAVNG